MGTALRQQLRGKTAAEIACIPHAASAAAFQTVFCIKTHRYPRVYYHKLRKPARDSVAFCTTLRRFSRLLLFGFIMLKREVKNVLFMVHGAGCNTNNTGMLAMTTGALSSRGLRVHLCRRKNHSVGLTEWFCFSVCKAVTRSACRSAKSLRCPARPWQAARARAALQCGNGRARAIQSRCRAR